MADQVAGSAPQEPTRPQSHLYRSVKQDSPVKKKKKKKRKKKGQDARSRSESLSAASVEDVAPTQRSASAAGSSTRRYNVADASAAQRYANHGYGEGGTFQFVEPTALKPRANTDTSVGGVYRYQDSQAPRSAAALGAGAGAGAGGVEEEAWHDRSLLSDWDASLGERFHRQRASTGAAAMERSTSATRAVAAEERSVGLTDETPWEGESIRTGCGRVFAPGGGGGGGGRGGGAGGGGRGGGGNEEECGAMQSLISGTGKLLSKVRMHVRALHSMEMFDVERVTAYRWVPSFLHTCALTYAYL